MNTQTRHSTANEEPSQAVFAEAAAWVARLHGPHRTLQTDKGLRRWLDTDPAHASAFEAMTAAWEITAKLPQPPFPRLSRWQRAGYREGFIRSAVAVAGIAAVAIGTVFYLKMTGGVATEVGEQRTLSLEDGTRVTLNTDTRLFVRYDEHHRTIELKSGEAWFEVAKDSQRPFVVDAGSRRVQALGTSFVVRRDEHEIAVTLVDGKVAVSSLSPSVPALLIPGQRLTFAANQAPKIDRPAIEKVTAWRRGLVDFENTPLADAVTEMNRYSALKVSIVNLQTADIAITGVFRASDAASFAAAVARAYQLQIVEDSGHIQLIGMPAGESLP